MTLIEPGVAFVAATQIVLLSAHVTFEMKPWKPPPAGTGAGTPLPRRSMSCHVAPPLVVMSMKPPAAPTAMRFRSCGLTPRLYEVERNRRVPGSPGDNGPPPSDGSTAFPMRFQLRPPLVVRQTRALEKWKNTRPVGSRLPGAATTAVKNP